MDDRHDAVPGAPPHPGWDAFHDARDRFLRALALDAEVFRLERALAAPAASPRPRPGPSTVPTRRTP
ncbi:MAG: hypothetical protein MUE51_13670 [Thermoleophilia bacterium]|jgi:hypothetical protein|nr:hypothetical protein [Thermoleophilia bacterium]